MMSVSACAMSSDGCLYDLLIERFFVEHHIWSDDSPTFTIWHTVGFHDRIKPIALTALHAIVAMNAPMKLMHALRPCRLMQAVNILRDHTTKDALLLKFGELLVRLIRFGIFMHHLCSVKIVKDIGVRFEERMTYNDLRRIRVRLIKDAFGATEIRDAAFC